MTPGVHSLVKASAVQALDALHAPTYVLSGKVVGKRGARSHLYSKSNSNPCYAFNWTKHKSETFSHSAKTSVAWPARQQAGLPDAVALLQQLAMHKLECSHTRTRWCTSNSNERES